MSICSDGFKREYARFLAAEKKKLKLMNNDRSEAGRKLKLDKQQQDHWDMLRNDVCDRFMIIRKRCDVEDTIDFGSRL